MEQLTDLYYDGKKPDNIKIYFLNGSEYEKKYKQLSKQLYGEINNDYKSSVAHCLYDKAKDQYHVLVKNFDGDFYNAYALNLFHELGHVDTMPHKIGTTLICSSKKKDIHALVGFEFWKEYIAHYEAINRYQMLIDKIHFLSDKETTRKVMQRLKKSYKTLLYEIVLYSEITGVYLEGVEEETKELIEHLKQTRAMFKSKEEMKQIKKKELDKIGKAVVPLTDAITEREKNENFKK